MTRTHWIAFNAEPTQVPGLWTHFQEGGWMMWWILALGLVAVTAAARFAWRGEHLLLPFVRWQLLAILLAGAAGFILGMLNVLRYVVERVQPERRLEVLLEGTREALNNVSLATLLVLLGVTLVAVGYRRFPLPSPSSLGLTQGDRAPRAE